MSKFQGTIVGARVRLVDGSVGTILAMTHADQFELGYKGSGGKTRFTPVSDIAECGDDVKHRCTRYCHIHGIKFVSMTSLCS